MKVTITQGKYGTIRKFTRDKWCEWFVIEISEGEFMPFYFPVTHSYMTRISKAWIWYLLPIVLPLFLLNEVIKHIFIESRRILNTWIKYNNYNK